MNRDSMVVEEETNRNRISMVDDSSPTKISKQDSGEELTEGNTSKVSHLVGFRPAFG